MKVAGKDTHYFGEEALAKKVTFVSYPIKNGVVTDWEAMERMWHHAFYDELNVVPEEQPVLLTEPPLNPKVNREKMAEVPA